MNSTLVLFLLVAYSLACATESYCNQTWYTDKDGDCVCGVELSGVLRCNDCYKTVDITAGFCMTYDTTRQYVGENTSSLLIVGDCPHRALPNTTNRKLLLYQLILLRSTAVSVLPTIVEVCSVESVWKDLVPQFTPLISTVPTVPTCQLQQPSASIWSWSYCQ